LIGKTLAVSVFSARQCTMHTIEMMLEGQSKKQCQPSWPI